MASSYDALTDDAVGILDKAIKTKPKDVKARTDLQKKANAKLKELQKFMADTLATFTKTIDATTRKLEEAVGVAASEAKLFDREIVRHLKQAIKLSKAIERPKGLTDDFDKAAKTVASWDPKAEGVEELKKGTQYLEAGIKSIESHMAAHRKDVKECNETVKKAFEDLKSLNDPHLKELISPYLTEYAEFFQTPS
jgi:chromosome segregation ATPase